MNIQKYMIFVYSSFTKTTKILNYSQSAISHMINDF